MNAAHLHLVLNHLPVIGMVFGLATLLYALWRRSEDFQRFALGLLVIVALTAIPTFLTGEPAEELVEHLAGVSHQAIEAHEESATLSLALAIALGVLAAGALVGYRNRKLPALLLALIVVVSAVDAALLAVTANLGGAVRHTEIYAAASPEGDDGEHRESAEH